VNVTSLLITAEPSAFLTVALADVAPEEIELSAIITPAELTISNVIAGAADAVTV
jgi:hypothetical protein